MIERRGFLGAMMGAALAPELAGVPTPPTGSPGAQVEEWDMSWLDRLTGKHRQVFDLSNVEAGLRVVKNWYEAHLEVYGLKHPALNAVIGIAAAGFPINASDPLYQKFPIGELWKVTDPDTGKPALRNIFLEGAKAGANFGAGVRPLQARGAFFWMCNNALHGVAARIGAAVSRPEPEVYQELRSGLNPGVTLIVAHSMLIGLCQERGCAYEAT